MLRLLFAVVTFVAALAVAAPVFAHSEPAQITPGDGAVVTTPPGEIVITMSQDMARTAGANDIDVIDEEGNEVTVVAAVIDNATRRTLSVPLPSNLESGKYRVLWKTLSDEDGDTASGELSFRYDPAGIDFPGQVNLREELGAPTAEAGNSGAAAPPVIVGGGGGGASWILVTAVGAGMFALGAGVTFVLIQRKP